VPEKLMLRQVIINADDFGLVDSVNEAIVEVFKAGRLSSATLMVNMPGTPGAVGLALANPGLAVGLHFCLTEGTALSGPSSITDGAGQFFSRRKLLLRMLQRRIRLGDVAAEYKAQLERFDSFEIPLSHIDSHEHVHMIPVVFRAILPLLRERRAPLRVVEPFHLRSSNPLKAWKQLLLRRSARRIRDKYSVTPNTHLVSVHDRGGAQITAAGYHDLLTQGGDRGVLELMVHPYRPDDDLKSLYGAGYTKRQPFLEKCFDEHRVLVAEDVVPQTLELTTYQMADEIQTRPMEREDLPPVSDLIQRENSDSEVSASSLEHWYFGNPIGDFTAEVALRRGTIQGVATTNNFRFLSGDRSVLVGMPQKVLTSRSIRGRGVFGRLYFETERVNLEERGVEFFMTFTNKASTQIFLRRFGFVRGPSPRLVLLPSSPMSLLRRRRYRAVEDFDSDFLGQDLLQMPYGLEKDRTFYQWRYGDTKPGPYLKLEVGGSSDRAGYVVLRRVKKSGLPVYLLMDVVASHSERLPELFRQAQRFVTASGTVGLLCFSNIFTERGMSGQFTIPVGSPFNFLVKGRSDRATQDLVDQDFNLSFGDVDFY
jgi:hypothetical protein